MLRAILYWIAFMASSMVAVVLAIAFHDTVARDFLRTKFKGLKKKV